MVVLNVMSNSTVSSRHSLPSLSMHTIHWPISDLTSIVVIGTKPFVWLPNSKTLLRHKAAQLVSEWQPQLVAPNESIYWSDKSIGTNRLSERYLKRQSAPPSRNHQLVTDSRFWWSAPKERHQSVLWSNIPAEYTSFPATVFQHLESINVRKAPGSDSSYVTTHHCCANWFVQYLMWTSSKGSARRSWIKLTFCRYLKSTRRCQSSLIYDQFHWLLL